MREAQILSELRHPNLPAVIDYFVLPSLGQYLVMNFVEGDDLQQMLDQVRQPMPTSQVATWMAQICDALIYLHSQTPPIIHRDIKPANIKITAEGKAVLIDFGLAKLYDPNSTTTRGARAVSPGFSPPEQYGKGGRTDARSDVYALGATLYALVTNTVPAESTDRLSGGELPLARNFNPTLSLQLDRAIMKAMAMQQAQRYQSVAELKIALLASTITLPAKKNWWDRFRVWLPRSTQQGVAAVVILAALIFLAVWSNQFGLPSAPQLPTASAPQSPTAPALQSLSAPAPPLLFANDLFTSTRGGKREIYRFAQDGKVVQVTNTSGKNESWGPVLEKDGSILFTSDRSGKREVYRLSAFSSEPIRVTTTTQGGGESWGALPEAGGDILFVSTRAGKQEIYRLVAKTGVVVQITNSPDAIGSWGPIPEANGDLLFVSKRSGKKEIYRLIAKTGEVSRVTTTSGVGESWSPVPEANGDLLFVSTRAGKRDIFRMVAKTGQVVQVTQSGGQNESPVPESDGSFLFVSDRTGKREVYHLLSGTGAVVQVTNSSGFLESWLPPFDMSD